MSVPDGIEVNASFNIDFIVKGISYLENTHFKLHLFIFLFQLFLCFHYSLIEMRELFTVVFVSVDVVMPVSKILSNWGLN